MQREPRGGQAGAGPSGQGLARSYYSDDLGRFLAEGVDSVLGRLSSVHGFDLPQTERDAWAETVRILQAQLAGMDGRIMLEYAIPRTGLRVDAVVIASGMVFVLEFKAGKGTYAAPDMDQVMDYALYIKYFHAGSRNAPVVPVLVATRAGAVRDEAAWDRGVAGVLRSCGGDLGDVVRRAASSSRAAAQIDAAGWERAGYSPTPTIIEAARMLYQGHTVRDIRQNDAGAENLARTIAEVEQIIADSRRRNAKSICFVTGVPGAGKTLAGMEIASGANRRHDGDSVFLSGNMYLVGVLQEALVRDAVRRRRERAAGGPAAPGATKKSEMVAVAKFIQKMHIFRNEYFGNKAAPHERIVVFDEAQRTWSRDELARYMKKKHGRTDITVSEPEQLVGTMDRHEGWAVVVCLMGEGQEIHRGEVGPAGWREAAEKFPRWDVYAPDAAGWRPCRTRGPRARGGGSVHARPGLRLSVPLRSFRSAHVAEFVDLLLGRDAAGARGARGRLGEYLVFRTRRLDAAKGWLRRAARGTERYGIVASSQSLRLQPHGIYVSLAVDAVKWFLGGRGDPKSSYSMEYAATEFKAQGLEVDWACVAWDADLRYGRGGWTHRQFPRHEVGKHQRRRSAAVPRECVQGPADARPAGHGDIRAGGGRRGSDAPAGVLRRHVRLPRESRDPGAACAARRVGGVPAPLLPGLLPKCNRGGIRRGPAWLTCSLPRRGRASCRAYGARAPRSTARWRRS